MIADATESAPGRRRLRLFAFRYEPDGYRPVEPDVHGRIWLEGLGLWLGVIRDVELDCDRLACYDGATGEKIGDYRAITLALEAALAERDASEQRACADLEARHQAETRAESEADARAETEARQSRRIRGRRPRPRRGPHPRAGGGALGVRIGGPERGRP